MANIYDVARRARVSVATVSAVVNGTAYVSPRLKARVERAIHALGYRPNLLARSLATRHSRLLGMIVPDIANPFWPEVVRGAEDRAQAAGYTLLLANGDDSAVKEEVYLSLFLANRVDGVILTKAPGEYSGRLIEHLAERRLPVVQLLRVSPCFDSDAVLLDDEQAAYEAVAHLVRLGARRIGFVGGPMNVSTGALRSQGYHKALADAGITADPALSYEGNFRHEAGYQAGLALLKLKPDAVFISNYLMASGFVKAMRQYQIRCPRDIGVVTCDDHPWLDAFSPRLTTVNFPKHELGSEAARVLIERVSKPDAPLQTIQMKSALVIRESCGYAQRVLLT